MAAPGTETPMLLRSRRAGILRQRRHKTGTPKFSRKPPPQPLPLNVILAAIASCTTLFRRPLPLSRPSDTSHDHVISPEHRCTPYVRRP